MSMNILRRPLRFLDGLIDRVCALIGAVMLSQFPQYYGQYMQRLGGHLDEALKAVSRYEKAAAEHGLTLEEYIQHHIESTSEVFVSSGHVIQSLVERYHNLLNSFNALSEANIFNRWFIFLREIDLEIARNTWHNFVPGIPTTAEGFIYALCGLFLGWGTYVLIKKLFTLPSKLINKNQGKYN